MSQDAQTSPGDNTATQVAAHPTAFERARDVLDMIRPAIQDDGGDVVLVEVTKKGVAKVRMSGECLKCPSRDMTLKDGIEKNLVQRVPEVVSVEQVD